jgi:hypothetical protein
MSEGAMKIIRERTHKGRRFSVRFKLELTPEELAAVQSGGLYDYKIQHQACSMLGETLTTTGMSSSFNAQIGKIRNRWSVALVRTSGSVFVDLLILYLKAIKEVIGLVWRLFFGGRKRLSGLLRPNGLQFKAKRVEDLKETELFVLTSIAAIHKAIDLVQNANRRDEFDNDNYRAELAGLTFAGFAEGAVLDESLADEALSAIEDIAAEALDALPDISP